MTMTPIERTLEMAYDAMEGNQDVEDYHARHGIESAAILTVTDDERAGLVADYLSDRIRGKVVVEIGGGIGLLAMHMSEYAKRVYVIEADPVWTSVYVAFLHVHKPKNVTFIFGAADEMAGQIHGDVALFCTHSDADGMLATARLFADEAIDVYGELLSDRDDGQTMALATLRTRKALDEFIHRTGKIA